MKIRKAHAAALAFAIVLGGCGLAKSDAEQATDALNKGVAAQNAGKNDEATKAYFEALAKEPKAYLPFYNLGQIARVSNKMAIAEGYYRQAIELNPNYAPAIFGLAIARSSVPGAVPEVIALYRQVIALDPNNAAAHYNLGLNLRQTGSVVEGDAEVAKGISLDKTLPAPPPVPSATPRPSASPAR